MVKSATKSTTKSTKRELRREFKADNATIRVLNNGLLIEADTIQTQQKWNRYIPFDRIIDIYHHRNTRDCGFETIREDIKFVLKIDYEEYIEMVKVLNEAIF